MGVIIQPGMWDDDKVVSLSRHGQLVWFHLITCYEATVIPGLLRGTIASVTDSMRWESEVIESTFKEFIDRGMMQLDIQHRLIRLPNGPKHHPPGNPNIIVGWFRKWSQIPDCQLKSDHVPSIRAATKHLMDGDDKYAAKWNSVWDATFGSVAHKTYSKQESLPYAHIKPFESLSKGSSEKQKQNEKPDEKQKPEQKPALAAGSSSPSVPESAQPGLFSVPQQVPSSKPPAHQKKHVPLQDTHLDPRKAMETISTFSKGRLACKPWDSRVEPSLKGTMIELRKGGVSQHDLEVTGEWIAAGGINFPLGVSWALKPGNLSDAIGKAIQWDAAGRGPIRTMNAPDTKPRDVTKGSLRAVGYDDYAPTKPTQDTETFIDKNL